MALRASLLLMAVTLIAGSAYPKPPLDPAVPIRTDKATYTLVNRGGYSDAVVATTYNNLTKRPLYIATCGRDGPPFYRLEQYTDGVWMPADAGGGCTSATVAHRVRPGGVFTFLFDVRVQEQRPPNFLGLSTEDLPGNFRFNFFSVYDAPTGGRRHQLPERWRVSNAFMVRRYPAGTPVVCRDIPWRADFGFFEVLPLVAPGTADLWLYPYPTGGRCEPSFTVRGTRFYAYGRLLGEGRVAQRREDGNPSSFRYRWHLTPERDGVPVQGSANLTLSAAVVVERAGEAWTLAAHGTSRVRVVVKARPSPRQRKPPPVRTDEASYTLDVDEHRYLLTLEATYTNRTGATVYFERFCGNVDTPWFSLEKRLGDGWVTALALPCPLVGGIPPIEVKPGERYTATVEAEAYRGPNVAPSFEVTPIPGRYRLVFEAYTKVDENDFYALSDPLPVSQRVSNAFILKLP